MDLALSKGFLARTLAGLGLMGGLASPPQAGTVRFFVLPSVFTALGTSSANYSTAVVTAGCIPGFSSSLQPSAILNPTSLGAGLTTATLNLSQPMTSGGTAVAIATASIDQGAIHLYGDSQGTPIGCGGSCQTTGGSAFPEALFDDTLHFIITDTATSAIGTFQANLDGVIGLESDFEGSFGNYSVSESFLFGGGSGCWGAQTGLTPGPCGSQIFFFFNDTATTEIYTLLHDALPIYNNAVVMRGNRVIDPAGKQLFRQLLIAPVRSEEHTSELQSLRHLVCRLLL